MVMAAAERSPDEAVGTRVVWEDVPAVAVIAGKPDLPTLRF